MVYKSPEMSREGIEAILKVVNTVSLLELKIDLTLKDVLRIRRSHWH
jgi:hypothetical protein